MTKDITSAKDTSPLEQSSDAKARARSWLARIPWVRYPEFWAIVLVAALLRLWFLDHSQWLDDQAQLLTLARDAWLHGALPITGIRSSIGTLNPPLSVYILMPFFLFTKSPLPALIGLALWNIFGVALCYIFALRFFSRRAAFCSALVFACCGAAINYSRFIWQQNYLPPLLLLWAFTLYAGVVRGRRNWLALHLLLLVMIISLHPTGLTLLAVTVVALLIAPHWPTRRDALLGVGLVVLLLLPTILWELTSGFSDAQLLRQFSQQPPVVNFDVFHAIYHLLGAPAYPGPGTNTPYPAILDTALYARIDGLNVAIQNVTMALYIVCYLALTVLTLAPLRRVRVASSAAGWRRVWGWLLALRTALQADARWRSYLLLWVWLTIPPLTMLRHGKTVQPHYLFILYPAFFLSIGVAVDAIIREGPRVLAALRIHARQTQAQLQRIIVGGALAVVLLVALGQGAQSALFIAALGSNQVSTVNFGYPLNQLLSADSALAAIQREQHAGGIIVSMPSRYTASALDSTLIREEADRTGVTGDCLALPGSQAEPTLVVSTRAASPQARLLATLPNATRVQDIAMPGDEPLVVYRLSGPTPLLPDERALPSVTWHSGDGSALQLVAGARIAPGVIRLRWVVEQWTVPHDVNSADMSATPQFEMQVRAQTAAKADAPTSAPVARATCQPSRLQVGETLFTWISTAWSANGTSLTAVAPPLPTTPLALSVLHGTLALWQKQIGPLRVLSAAPSGIPLAPMTTTSANGANGSYPLPITLTGSAAP
ncbi:MAG TPA: glycosyltransferase family 39 protein [Ktedonobacterales bacterium]|nr:glycosyltransferase family 39 protein [Ktedonobacterales bacterium]